MKPHVNVEREVPPPTRVTFRSESRILEAVTSGTGEGLVMSLSDQAGAYAAGVYIPATQAWEWLTAVQEMLG